MFVSAFQEHPQRRNEGLRECFRLCSQTISLLSLNPACTATIALYRSMTGRLQRLKTKVTPQLRVDLQAGTMVTELQTQDLDP